MWKLLNYSDYIVVYWWKVNKKEIFYRVKRIVIVDYFVGEIVFCLGRVRFVSLVKIMELINFFVLVFMIKV